MARKKTQPMQDQPLRREAIEPQMFVEAMRRLLRSDDFKLLRRFWASERIGLIENVKSKRTADECAVLDGFDRAIIVPEIWAHKTTGDDVMKERHRELMESLHGDRK